MKHRFLFLAFALLILVSPLASADQTSTPSDPASANLAAIFSAPTSPSGMDAKLPSFEPAPTNKAGILCGSCSDTVCQGQQVGNFCKYQNGKTYTCQIAYYVCAPKDCQCWNGPLP
jgi:hypothetical protein